MPGGMSTEKARDRPAALVFPADAFLRARLRRFRRLSREIQ